MRGCRYRNMRVLIACEFSGVVREAFRARGHDAWSCDLLPSMDNSPYHFQKDILGLLEDIELHKDIEPFDLMIAHPPCTYLSSSGLYRDWETVSRPFIVTGKQGNSFPATIRPVS